MSDALRILIENLATKTIKDGGVTYSFVKSEYLEDVDKWFYPKYPALTRIVPVDDLTQALSDFVDRHAELLEQENMYLGTWINPESGKCHLDMNTACATKEEALADAYATATSQAGKILAIYNPHLDASVPVQ